MGTISPLLSSFSLLSSLLLLLLLLTFSPISIASNPASVASPNPFTAKAATLRYWARKIPGSSTLPRPAFLVSKLSPLSALDSATYSSLAAKDPVSLLTHLPAFCTAARLLCGPVLTPSLASQASHRTDANFSNYDSFTNYTTFTATAENFTSYGAGRAGGQDSFTNYIANFGFINTFRSYSRDGEGHDASFTRYSDGNSNIHNFTSYGSGATGGNSGFTNYEHESNVPDLKFTNYAANSNGHTPTFTSYSDDNNAGEQSFAGYGKDGNSVPTTFTSYGTNSNAVGSTFTGYGESGNGAADSFTLYGNSGNAEEVNFGNYGENGNGAVDSFTLYGANISNVDVVNFGNYGKNGNGGTDTFTSYRDQANIGDTSFKSYAKGPNAGTAGFIGYGKSFNTGSDSFKGYGLGNTDPNVTFKSYSGDNTSFKEYAKTGVNFNSYKNASIVPSSAATAMDAGESLPQKAHAMNKWVVEPGKFFRESSLKNGTVIPMPDIRDRMPQRSFLPRSISGKIPSSADMVRQVFMLAVDSAMGKAVGSTISECQRAPSKGETKKCAMSAEDVIDFAESVLGEGAVVRSTATARGSGQNVIVGDVRGIDGGKITKSVSCHQSLYPYLVYYCHSVPKVRVYEADILAVDSEEKINRGVAICHVDTSDWSAGHGAFVALGSGPGKIEVCHWIFQGDMTWTVQD